MTTAPVIIDWARESNADSGQQQYEISALVDWVRAYPRRGDIHVYLRANRKQPKTFAIRSSLMALGCRVTVMHTALSSTAAASTEELSV